MSRKVNVYDFDHTIYDGDASVDFLVYILRHHPKTWRYIPLITIALFNHIFGLWTRKRVKQTVFSVLKPIANIDNDIERFWHSHQAKVNEWYRHQHQKTDVIVSASPEFLLQPIANKLGFTVIGTQMDSRSGKITGENCRGKEKVKRLDQHEQNLKIVNCYSDSLSDRYLFDRAENAFVVRRSKIIPFNEYHPSKFSKLKSRAFLRFLFVGGASSFFAFLFASLSLLFIDSPVVSWVAGYVVSLIPSYFLNSTITFKQYTFSIRKFGTFVVSYIPNFVIQFVCVYILAGVLAIHPLIAYILAVIIVVPMTFLLLALFAFRKRGGKMS